MKKPTKLALLAKYSEREPRRFIQLDAHYAPDDNVMSPDAEGDALTGGDTFELMHGASVRVLIDPECEPARAVRRLRKLAAWLERMPDLMKWVPEPANVVQVKPTGLAPEARRELARRNVEALREDYENNLAIARYVEEASGGDPNAALWDYRDRDSEGSK